jgi:hypothetical protein
MKTKTTSQIKMESQELLQACKTPWKEVKFEYRNEEKSLDRTLALGIAKERKVRLEYWGSLQLVHCVTVPLLEHCKN